MKNIQILIINVLNFNNQNK